MPQHEAEWHLGERLRAGSKDSGCDGGNYLLSRAVREQPDPGDGTAQCHDADDVLPSQQVEQKAVDHRGWHSDLDGPVRSKPTLLPLWPLHPALVALECCEQRSHEGGRLDERSGMCTRVTAR